MAPLDPWWHLKRRVKKRRWSRLEHEQRRAWVRARGSHAFSMYAGRDEIPAWLAMPYELRRVTMRTSE